MFRALSLAALLTACAPAPAPSADAGAFVTGSPGEVYLLDGSSSQGEGLRFSWVLLDGPDDAQITDADTQTAYLQPSVEGVYTLSLTVCDRWDRCDEAETVALVGEAASRQRLASFSGGGGLGFKPFGKNRAPVADAVAARALGNAGTIKLDGRASSDPDGDSLRYRWSFTSRPAGSALTDADIQDGTDALASFRADVAGAYSVRLVVRDGMLADSVDLPGIVAGILDDNDPLDDLNRRPGTPQHAETAQRSSLGAKAKNRAPEAQASASRSMGLSGTIKLDGSASSDPDGDSLRYRWTFTSRPAGSALTDADITNSTCALASFTGDVKGTYGVKLVVRDGMLADSVVLPDIVLSYVDDNDPLEDPTHRPGTPQHAEAAQRSSLGAPDTFAGVESGAGAILDGALSKSICSL